MDEETAASEAAVSFILFSGVGEEIDTTGFSLSPSKENLHVARSDRKQGGAIQEDRQTPEPRQGGDQTKQHQPKEESVELDDVFC